MVTIPETVPTYVAVCEWFAGMLIGFGIGCLFSAWMYKRAAPRVGSSPNLSPYSGSRPPTP